MRHRSAAWVVVLVSWSLAGPAWGARPDPRSVDGQGAGSPGGGVVGPRKVPAEDTPRLEKVANAFIVGNMGFYPYGGSTKTADHFAAALNRAATVLAGRAKIYVLVVPTAVEFHLPEKYQSLTNSQHKLMQHLHGRLQSVTAIDVHKALSSHKDQYLYFRTDHHWTALGAFYAYEVFARALGYTPNPLSAYQAVVIGKFWGTLYGATKSPVLGRNPDVVTAYKPAGSYTVTNFNSAGRRTGTGAIIFEGARNMSDKYVTFLTGDQAYVRIVNDGAARRAKKLMVIKGSFGNVFVPFLAPDFKEIHVADLRYFPHGLLSFVTANGIDEVLVIVNMFSVCDYNRIKNLQRLIERK